MALTRRSFVSLAAAITACSRPVGESEGDPIARAMNRLRRQARRKAPPQDGEWLKEHSEPGQTYAQFRGLVKTPAIDSFDTLRLVPVGPVSDGQTSVMNVVRDFLPVFFGLRLVEDPPVDLASIPAPAQREHFNPDPRQQLLTSYLLNEVLMSRRKPKDAAVLGITAIDLWPGEGWNFVFGQASLKERVGVWSMYRNGDPDWNHVERRRCALRTVMTATHETGHMFGIRHCIAYECGMNGSNSSWERDRQPLEFCPECQAKLWWTLKLDPVKRSQALEAVARKHDLPQTADAFARQTRTLQG